MHGCCKHEAYSGSGNGGSGGGSFDALRTRKGRLEADMAGRAPVERARWRDLARASCIGARHEEPHLFRPACKNHSHVKKSNGAVLPYSPRRDLSISAIKNFCHHLTPRRRSRSTGKVQKSQQRHTRTQTHRLIDDIIRVAHARAGA